MKNKKSIIAGAVMAAFVVMTFIACQLFISDVEYYQPQPDGTMAPRIKAGEVATFVIRGGAKDQVGRDDPQILIFAMLAPKDWHLRDKASITYTLTQLSDGETPIQMAPLGENESPSQMAGYTWNEALMDRFGIGSNILNDMEWVTFQSVESFRINNGDTPIFEITVKVEVPETNQRASLGFFVNSVQDGMTGDNQYWDTKFTEPFTIYDGKGNLTDYCSYHFYSAEPTKALQDDLITFSFVGNAYENDLIGGDVYIRITAVTDEGNEFTVTRKMDYPEANSSTYNVTIWPAGCFLDKLAEDEIITRLDYAFTNADGSIVIDLAKDLEMAGESFTPGQPFNLELSCQ